MTFLKSIVGLGLALSFISCGKKNDKPRATTQITATGVSLKADSPYAAALTTLFCDGFPDSATTKLCGVDTIPFIGENGEAITRDVLKEHTLISNEANRAKVNAYIDQIPDQLLPLFARVRVLSTIDSKNENDDSAASYGILVLSGFLGYSCATVPLLCGPESIQLKEWTNLLQGVIYKDKAHILDPFEAYHQSILFQGLCNVADAYAGQDLNTLSKQKKITLTRFSKTAAYPYAINQNLKNYWANAEQKGNVITDPNLLAAGMDDASASAINAFESYQNATSDFLFTCASYLQLKLFETKLVQIVLDPKTGSVYKTKKNQLGDAAVKAKLEKMLPVIFADPAADLNLLEAVPPSEALTQDEQERLLRRYIFK